MLRFRRAPRQARVLRPSLYLPALQRAHRLYYWLPLVAVRTEGGALYLRRGTIEIPDSSPLKARALILEPDHAFFVADHVVLRSGVRAERYFRRTRSSDGTNLLWLARKSGLGPGQGLSGLKFDIVRDKKPATT